MKLMNQKHKYNLQFFADKGEGSDGSDNSGDDGDDNQDDDQEDKDSGDKKSDKKTEKKFFTQDELDEAIKVRLKRERKKAENKQDRAKDDKQGDKGSDDKSKATDDKVSALEAKLLCFEHDVSKDSVSDVVALAKAYIDEDTDFEEAIEKVIKKYPQFIKGTSSKKGSDDEDEDEDEADNNKGSWGQRQKGTSKKVDSVEEAFLKKNPGLKV